MKLRVRFGGLPDFRFDVYVYFCLQFCLNWGRSGCLVAYCFLLEAVRLRPIRTFPPPSWVSDFNGRAVNGRLDDCVDRCLSSAIASLQCRIGWTGTSFTANILVSVADIDCDLVVDCV